MDKHADAVLFVLLFMAAILLSIAFMLSQDHSRTARDDQGNLVKIECFLHRDNADVRKLCVDKGYDH